jgi:predicted nucleotidyltransferase
MQKIAKAQFMHALFGLLDPRKESGQQQRIVKEKTYMYIYNGIMSLEWITGLKGN